MRLRETGLLLGISLPLVVAACGDDDNASDGRMGAAGAAGEHSTSAEAGAAGSSASTPVGGQAAGGHDAAGGLTSGGQPSAGDASFAAAAGASGDQTGASAGAAGAGGAGAECGDRDKAGGHLCFKPAYELAVEQGSPIDITLCQWQGEGGADLALITSSSSLWWYPTHENGTFASPVLLADVSGEVGVVLGSGRLDSGPGPDLIAGGDAKNTDIVFGTNGGHVSDTQLLSGDAAATNLFVADLPGSASGQDFVSVRGGYAVVNVTTGSAGAEWISQSVALYSGSPLAGDAVLARLDDASLYLTVSRLDQGSLLRAQVILGEPLTFGPADSVALEAPAAALDVGDFDDDGYQDIVAALAGPTHVNVLFGDGAGAFKPVAGDAFESLPAGPWLQDVKVGDFNGDGHDDIAATSRQDDAVVVIRGDGQGGFLAPVEIPLGAGAAPTRLAVSDLNEDGVDDIVVVTKNSLKILISNP